MPAGPRHKLGCPAALLPPSWTSTSHLRIQASGETAEGVGGWWGWGPSSHQASIKGNGERTAQPERIFNDPKSWHLITTLIRWLGLSLPDAAKGSPEKFPCLPANLLINIVIYFPLFYPTCVKQPLLSL